LTVAILAAEAGRQDALPQKDDEAQVDKAELQKVETYLRQTFSNAGIKVLARPKKTDSAEVYIGDEFIGIVFLDDEDGDRSYSFTMSILDTDLAGA
jgi:Protein of unknown function (DUF3126)